MRRRYRPSGAHWLAILYLTNNSANTVDAVVDCHFTNQGAKVEDVRLLVPRQSGERLGVPFGARAPICSSIRWCAVDVTDLIVPICEPREGRHEPAFSLAAERR